MKILVLGGTADARALAGALDGMGVEYLSSLAGSVSALRMPQGRVRVGGFGGVTGLAAFIGDEGVTHVIDATHPFASGISANAVAACAASGVDLLRLTRPGWGERADSTAWHWVDDLEQARQVADGLGERPFLTIGRQHLNAFGAWADRDVLVRVIDPPSDIPPRWTILCDRGPFNLACEAELLARHGIDVLLTKDSGGSHTSAKLDACAAADVQVVILRRPPDLAKQVVSSVEEAIAWLSL